MKFSSSKHFIFNEIYLGLPARSVGLLFIFVFAMLSSCNDDESVKKKKTTPVVTNQPTTTNPTVPTSATECSPHILYGYCDKVSYNKEEKVIVYLQSNQSISTCRLDVYDLNQKLIFSAPSDALFEQKIANDPAVNGYGFIANATLELPASIQSGIYLIDGKIPFLVKDPKSVDLLIAYPSNTANAYCESGGRSLYSVDNRPTQVSFERPIPVQSESYAGLKWFSNLTGFSIGYVADIDLNDYTVMSSTKILVIVGHSEYWSLKARRNFDKFIASGGHAIILSGNTMWWQIRYSDDKKKLVCHKDPSDPIADPLLKTLVWAEPALQYSIIPSIGVDFNYGGYGVRYADDGWDGFKIALPQSPLLQGLNFKKGDVLRLPSAEYDGAPLKEFVDGYPVIDNSLIGAYRIQLIGFDYGLRGGKTTVGTFIVMQPKTDSGVIVNVGSLAWCSDYGMGGPDKNKFNQITLNAINGMLSNNSLFAQ